MKTHMALFAASLALTGCPQFRASSTSLPRDGGPLPDTALDAGCRGEAPRCVQRAGNGVCGDSGVLGRCLAGTWTCPSGLVDQAVCACSGLAANLSCLRRNENGSCSENGALEICTSVGWQCPSGSVPRAQCTCVGSGCSTCPIGFEESRRGSVNCYAIDDTGRCDFARAFHNASIVCGGIVRITCPPGFAGLPMSEPSAPAFGPLCWNRPNEDGGVHDGGIGDVGSSDGGLER